MLLLTDLRHLPHLRQSFADTTNLQLCLSPNLRPNRRHPIIIFKLFFSILEAIIRRDMGDMQVRAAAKTIGPFHQRCAIVLDLPR
jgi:hypothetical protein